MNKNFTYLAKVIAQVPAIAMSLQGFKGMSGADKLMALQAAVTASLPTEDQPDFIANYWPQVSAYVTMLVTLWQTFHPSFIKTPPAV